MPSGGGRFSIRSPNVEVSSEAVLPLAMVLNELCTNATKYGALSNANGEVEISATVDEPREDHDHKLDTYEAVSCHACGCLHWVNPRSGRVLGTQRQ